MRIDLSDEVSGAVHFDRPIVALESTVIAQGLPFPTNIETALRLEAIVREVGAVPATVAVLGGRIKAGLNIEEIEHLAKSENVRKASIRDLPIAIAGKLDCATTVATTTFIARKAGIRVFATGGIGGVHRGSLPDISADLPQLAENPIIVVCSGAKAVLDLPATREWLETHGVPVIGWRCSEFPAFFSRSSGLGVDVRLEKASDVAKIAEARGELGLQQALLVVNPVPEADEIPRAEAERLIADALGEAAAKRITGKTITPFLLSELAEKSSGRTMRANIALLESNARVAAEIALAL
ncbi:MAG: pseudouridine-5'-phosphate glycosidase [Acidobacteria bacterium]|nr:pseudouridine-5'-phosphate glycosidase [Acidobacteriota bacterium]